MLGIMGFCAAAAVDGSVRSGGARTGGARRGASLLVGPPWAHLEIRLPLVDLIRLESPH